MSYDVYLKDPVSGEALELEAPHHMRGGTYAVGGTTEARLNVTYNYCKLFRATLGEQGIRSLYGQSGAASIPMLTEAIGKLGNERDPDYWLATEGNVKAVLMQLRALAWMRPDGVWDGD